MILKQLLIAEQLSQLFHSCVFGFVRCVCRNIWDKCSTLANVLRTRFAFRLLVETLWRFAAIFELLRIGTDQQFSPRNRNVLESIKQLVRKPIGQIDRAETIKNLDLSVADFDGCLAEKNIPHPDNAGVFS